MILIRKRPFIWSYRLTSAASSFPSNESYRLLFRLGGKVIYVILLNMTSAAPYVVLTLFSKWKEGKEGAAEVVFERATKIIRSWLKGWTRTLFRKMIKNPVKNFISLDSASVMLHHLLNRITYLNHQKYPQEKNSFLEFSLIICWKYMIFHV